jgi:phosphoglycolate phosphatase-like HAD superfamily hydrolase
MAAAVRDVFGINGLGGLALSGRTDAWIMRQLSGGAARAGEPGTRGRFQAAYLKHLFREIGRPASEGLQKGIMPGVVTLLDHLAERDDAYLGLLTGNMEEGARIKLEHFDLWKYFGGGAFGGETEERRELFSAALASVKARAGTHFTAAAAIVIGDTPFDVEVARAHGARSVAVATGGYDKSALEATGADVVLDDFSDLDRSIAALELD